MPVARPLRGRALKDLGPERAFIFRIIHRDNLGWVLQHGMHCRSAGLVDPNYVEIGNPDLIGKRNVRPVPLPPGGTLSDYVPFYFTPRTPMLLNIKTGFNGIRQRQNAEIAILVSSLRHIEARDYPFLFTDKHAYPLTTRYFNDLARLDVIDWTILQHSDFKRDLDDLGKVERYQAEALIHGQVPLDGLLGIACSSHAVAGELQAQVDAAGVELKVASRPRWYF